MFWLPDELQLRLVLVLTHFLWQGAAIAVALALLGTRLRSPRGRYLLSLGAFLMLALAPVGTWFSLPEFESAPTPLVVPMVEMRSFDETPPLDVEAMNDSINRTEIVVPSDGVVMSTSEEPLIPQPTEKAPTAVQPVLDEHVDEQLWWQPIAPAIVGCWLLGVLVLSLRLACGAITTWRWRCCALPLPESLRDLVSGLCQRLRMRSPRVGLSDRVVEAVAIGLLRPMVLLPVAWATSLPPDMLEAVLAHELAHIRRFDLWVNLLQGVVETLLFYHPAVWWMSRRLRRERELCCDELAVSVTRDNLRYAEMLEHVGRLRLSPLPSALTVSMSGNRHALLDRVRNVLQPRPRGDVWSGAFAVALLCSVLAVGLMVSSFARSDAGMSEVAADTRDVTSDAPPQVASDAASQGEVVETESAPVVVDLPNGRSFELVGITKNTALAKNGWKPDGSPIGDVGYWPSTIVLHGKNSSSAYAENGSHPEPDADAIDLLVRFRGLKEQPSLTFEMATNGSGYHQSPLKDPYEFRLSTRRRGEPSPGAKWSVPDGVVRVGLTDEPWGKWVQVSLQGDVLNPSEPGERHHRYYDKVLIHEAIEHERAPNKKALVLCQPKDASSLYNFEIRGIDEDGKPQWVLEWEGREVKDTDLKTGNWGLASSEKKPLARYEFRLRPYRHWVTLTGVSFEPGKKSKVETSTKTIPDPDRQATADDREVLQRLIRGGKINTSTIQLWVTQVARAGARDDEFARLVLAEFEKANAAEPGTNRLNRALLSVIAELFEAWSEPRWKTQLAARAANASPDVETEFLTSLIKHAYSADRGNIAEFTLAARMLHHSASRDFLRDVLRNSESSAPTDPFEPVAPGGTNPTVKPAVTPASTPPVPQAAPQKDAPAPKSKWKDNIGGGWGDAKFIAAVGLAELNDAEGVEWLLSKARDNEFGLDDSLFYNRHARDPRGSLRASCRLALSDLFGLNGTKSEPSFEQLTARWQELKLKFVARPVPLMLRLNQPQKVVGQVGDPDRAPEQVGEESSPSKGLEFLKMYPNLHGLSLGMTEPQVWELVKREELQARKQAQGQTFSLHISLGDEHMLLVMFDKEAKCSAIQRVRGDEVPPGGAKPEVGLGQRHDRLVWSHDSLHLVANGSFSKLARWERKDGRWSAAVADANRSANSIAVSRTSPLVVLGTNLGTVEVWDSATLVKQSLIKIGPEHSIYAVAISSDEKWIANCGTDGTVHLYDRATSQRRAVLGTRAETRMASLAFAPDGRSLAALDRFGQLNLWSIPDGARLADWRVADANENSVIQWSPDGKQMAATSWGRVTFIDAVKGSEPRILKAPDAVRPKYPEDASNGPINRTGGPDGEMFLGDCALAPDFRSAASVAPDASLAIWEVASGRIIRTLPAPPAQVVMSDSWGNGFRNLTYSPNGQRLACSTTRGDVIFWQLAQAEPKPNALRADVPNGVRLELVGLSTIHTGANKPDQRRWWDARGEVIGSTETLLDDKRRLRGMSEYSQGREAIVRLTVHRDSPFVEALRKRAAWIEGEVDGVSSTPSVRVEGTPPLLFHLAPNGPVQDDDRMELQLHTHFVPTADAKTTRLRFGFGHEATSRTYDDKGKLNHETSVNEHPEIWRRFGFLRMESRPEGTVVWTKPTRGLGDLGKASVRLLLVDGTTLNSVSPKLSDSGDEEQHVFNKVDIKDVEGVTLSVRAVTHWVTFSGLPLSATQTADAKVTVESIAHSGLEFLKPYPKLHGLSLDMTEPQFLEIVKQQKLQETKDGDGDKTAYRIGLGDGHSLIVMFRADGTCRGIQRIRDENNGDSRSTRSQAPLGNASEEALPQVPSAAASQTSNARTNKTKTELAAAPAGALDEPIVSIVGLPVDSQELAKMQARGKRVMEKAPQWLRDVLDKGVSANGNDEGDIVSIYIGKLGTDELLSQLATLPKLAELHIETTEKLTPAGLAHLGKLTSLTKASFYSLNTDELQLGDAAIRSVAQLKSLRELSVGECGTTDDGAKLLEGMTQLTSLSLRQEGRLTDAALKSIGKLTQLKSLSLDSYVGTVKHGRMRFSSEGIKELRGLSELESLHLVGHAVPPEALTSNKLKSLSLGNESVDDRVAARVAQMSDLRSLHLVYCGIGDVGLKEIAKLRKLTQVDISSNVITDAGMAAFEKHPTLTSLSLRAESVSDNTLRSLVTIPTLASLSLYGSGQPGVALGSRFTVPGLVQLKALPKLRKLSLTNLQTNGSYADLKELTQLQSLSFMMCDINNNDLQALDEAMPDTLVQHMTGGGGFAPNPKKVIGAARSQAEHGNEPNELRLADLIREFNAENKRLGRGLEQPALTEEEVIADIKRDMWKRGDPWSLNEQEIAAFKAVAESKRLPKGARLDVRTEERAETFLLKQLWKVQLLLPAIGHDGLVGLTIRDTKIAEEKIDPKNVAWGKPDGEGLTLGAYLSPRKAQYAVGERVRLRLFVRNDGKQPVQGLTFMRTLHPMPDDFTVTDDKGSKVGVRIGHEDWDHPWVSGATRGGLAPGDVHALVVPYEILIGGDGSKNELIGRVIDAQPGQRLQLKVREHNGSERKEGEAEPESGSVAFAVHEPTKNAAAVLKPLPQDDLRNEPIDASGEIHGVLLGKNNEPVVGATVACGAVINDSLKGGGANAVTDAEGRYRLKVPSPGIYNVWLKHAGAAGEEIPKTDTTDAQPTWTAAADDGLLVEGGKITTSKMQLIRGTMIAGTVVDASNQPQAGVRIYCYSLARPQSGSAVQSVKTDDKGEFKFWLVPGRAYVYASEDDRGHASVNIEVPRNGRPEPIEPLKLVLKHDVIPIGGDSWLQQSSPGTQIVRHEKAKDVTGTVVDADGQPIVGAKVFRYDGPIVTTNDKGEFTVTAAKGTQFIMFAFDPGSHVWFGTPTAGDVLKIVMEKKSNVARHAGATPGPTTKPGQPMGREAEPRPARSQTELGNEKSEF